jgi:2-dehydro-3-deoxygluconokinase
MTSERRFDVVTLGETMMRIVPPAPLRLGQAETLNISFGGAESTVAANLARLGRSTSWLSRVPQNPLGQQLVRTLRGYGVDTGSVVFDETARLGLYFVELGDTPRGIQVWYDRKNSAASMMSPDEIPNGWIEQARWLHLTGITPALSESCRQTALGAIRRAHDAGVTVSFDVNYRALLWPQHVAADILSPLCRQADVVFVARRDAASLFGVSGELPIVAETLQTRWGGTAVVTSGEQGAAAHDGIELYQTAAIPTKIVDRLGAGDAFTSGVIDQLLAGAPLGVALRFAAALAALKLSISGDIAFVTRAEVERVMRDKSPVLNR